MESGSDGDADGPDAAAVGARVGGGAMRAREPVFQGSLGSVAGGVGEREQGTAEAVAEGDGLARVE